MHKEHVAILEYEWGNKKYISLFIFLLCLKKEKDIEH